MHSDNLLASSDSQQKQVRICALLSAMKVLNNQLIDEPSLDER